MAGQITLSWTPAVPQPGTFITRYIIYRNTQGNWPPIGTTTTPSFVDMGLLDFTAYTYYVVAIDSKGAVSIASNQATATTPGPPLTVPANLQVTATTTTTVSLSWSAVTGASHYNLYRNGLLVGAPVALSFIDTALSPGTTYAYTVQAVDAANNTSAQSAPVNGTTLTTAQKVKWHPGHYSAPDAVWISTNTLANFTGAMDTSLGNLAGFGQQDHILGLKMSMTWGALESALGNYTAGFAAVDAMLNRLRTNYNKPKRLVLNILTTTITARGIVSSNDGSYVPPYIMQNASLYGASPFTGIASGIWGPSSGGSSSGGYAAAIWRAAVMDRFIAMIQAYGARYDSEPLFEAISFQEIFGANQGFANGDLGARDAPMTTQLQRLFPACVTAFPTTNVCHQNTDMQGQAGTIALEQYMMANRINPSSADNFGTRFFNGNPQDTIDGLNLDHQAAYAWWAILFSGGTQPAACNWSNLSPLLAAHPLTHTQYPGNYP